MINSSENSAKILAEYSGLPDGVTLGSELCPSCNGGRSRERTLSVTSRDGKLLCFCHRASCGYKYVHTFKYSDRIKERNDSTTCITNSIIPDSLSLAAREILSVSGISETPYGWGEKNGRIVVPCRDHLGNVNGWVMRAIDKDVRPKALTIKADSTAPSPVAWFVSEGSSLVIVEDVFSSYRASRYTHSLSLNGTVLNDTRVAAIANGCKFHGITKVYMCLDKDAFDKGVQYVTKYRSKLPSLLVVKLDQDLKRLSEEQLITFLKDKCNAQTR